MDYGLRCNSLKCRSQLGERAVVTTCSHIFCTRCSDELGLSGAASIHRACPACDTRLANNDDAVLTTLQPSEDHKTSVLSGLSPTIIMECAGRGLAFYSYQATQEIVYQEYMAKALTEKYSTLSGQMDQVIHEANAEIASLRNKLSDMKVWEDNLKDQCEKITEAYKEKSRQHHRAQHLYQELQNEKGHLRTAQAAQESCNSRLGNLNDPTTAANRVPHQPQRNSPTIHHHPQSNYRQRSGGSNEALNLSLGGAPGHYQFRGQYASGNLRNQMSTPVAIRPYATNSMFHGPAAHPTPPARQPLSQRNINNNAHPSPVFRATRDSGQAGMPIDHSSYMPAQNVGVAPRFAR